MVKLDNFEAWELVDPYIYEVYGEDSLKFIDPRLLKWIEWFREAINKPVYVNNYKAMPHPERVYDERGYRSNLCSIVRNNTENNDLYLSAHTRFQAIDFNVEDMNDTQVRTWLALHAEESPVNIRVERGTIGWCHIDVCNNTFNKITYFDA